MRKLTSKEIVLLIILVFIVSGALYYNYYYRPYQEKMMGLDLSINTENQRLLTLQSQQQAIIRDTERLNNELAGIQEEFHGIPEGIDEPYLLVYIEEALSRLAENAIIEFSPEIDTNEHFQTSMILLSFDTTYPNLKIILDTFYNAPFRNRITKMDAYYQERKIEADPQLEYTAEDTGQTLETAYNYLKVKMSVDCFSLQGVVNGKNYDFMVGPYNNTNPFEVSEYIEPEPNE